MTFLCLYEIANFIVLHLFDPILTLRVRSNVVKSGIFKINNKYQKIRKA
ncbi:MAG: hypothetical protein ACFWTN_03905 [Clostridium sp.]